MPTVLCCSGCGKPARSLLTGECYFRTPDMTYEQMEEETDLWDVGGSMQCMDCCHYCRTLGSMQPLPVQECWEMTCKWRVGKFPECVCGSGKCCKQHMMHSMEDPDHRKCVMLLQCDHLKYKPHLPPMDREGRRARLASATQ